MRIQKQPGRLLEPGALNARWAVWVLGVVTSLGCATTPTVKTDRDPAADLAQYKTFRFDGGKSVAAGALQASDPLVNDRVKAAVTQQLEAKGLMPSTDNPDLIVTFVAGAKQKTELEGPEYGGYEAGWWGPGYNDWWSRTYTEGTLIVDLIDARTNKPVWRAYATAPVDDAKQAAPLITQAMTKAFKDYPVAMAAPPPAPQPGYGGSGTPPTEKPGDAP